MNNMKESVNKDLIGDDMKNVEIEWPDDDSAIAAGASKHLFGDNNYDIDP